MATDRERVVRQAIDAFNRRDIDGYLARMDEEVETESRLTAMEGTYHGHEGVRRWWDNLLAMFPDFTLAVESAAEIGDTTIVRMAATAHGAESATPLQETIWLPIEWRGDRCARWRVFATREEAEEAAGL